MNIVYIHANEPLGISSAQHDVFYPAEALGKIEGVTTSIFTKEEFTGNTWACAIACQKADAIVVQRALYWDVLTRMMYWRVRGVKIIVVFDDDYESITEHNPAYAHWKQGAYLQVNTTIGKENMLFAKPDFMTQFIWGLRIADAIQVPSLELMNRYRKYGKTYYIPNEVDVENYKNVEKLFEHDGLVIGWAGGVSHYESFLDNDAVKGIEKFCEERPDTLLVIHNDDRIYNLFNVVNKKFVPFLEDEADYRKLLKSFDIGLAPLQTRFDMARSQLKVLEYAISGTPFIATMSGAYLPFEKIGKVIRNDAEEWYDALVETADNQSKYRSLLETFISKREPFRMHDMMAEKVILPLYTRIVNGE